MRLLYALQCTGNGHIARAHELLPILRKYADVDLLASGHFSQIELPQKPKFKFQGISLEYDDSGGLSHFKTLLKNDFIQLVADIQKLPIRDYDLIINDFEPVSAWAAKLKKLKNIIGLSHQASMLFDETPKPSGKKFLGKWVIKNYAPVKNYYGFHFESYHEKIFLPVIRKPVRRLNPRDNGFYMTYLPSYSDEFLIKHLTQTNVDWKIFSKSCSKVYEIGKIMVYPVDQSEFLYAFENCAGILCNAGFETPSEALFLNKKLFVIPIKNQYEQECNAEALYKMGVYGCKYFDLNKINQWLVSDSKLEIKYLDDSDELIYKLLKSI